MLYTTLKTVIRILLLSQSLILFGFQGVEAMFKKPNIFSYGVIKQQQREKLYNDIWSEPLKVVAAKYEISEATLRKYCTKFGVPLPPRGYWDKIKKGEQPHKRELPKVIGDLKNCIRNYVIQFQPHWKELSNEELLAGEGLFLLTTETQTYIYDICGKIEVKNQLRKPHPLIVEHQEEISYRKKRDREIEQVSYSFSAKWEVEKKHRKNKAVLPIRVSQDHIKRAYRIMDAFIKTLQELEGYIRVSTNWETHEDTASVSLMNNSFTFEFIDYDSTKRKPRSNKKPDTSPKPLKMIFTTCSSWKSNYNETLEYIDSGKNPLENQLAQIILDLFNLATKVTIVDEIEHREYDRKRAEEDRKRQFEKLQQQENNKLEVLQSFMKDWEYAKNLRQFAVNFEENMKGKIENSEQVHDLTTWIHQKADWFDPTICAKDPLLGQRHQLEEILKKLNVLK